MARDLEVFRWFEGIGIRVPAVIDYDLDTGKMVVEDLGNEDAESTLKQTAMGHRLPMLQATIRPLVTLALLEPSSLPRWNPPLGRDRMRWELAGFEMWYVRYLRDRLPSPELDRWLDHLAHEVAGHPLRVCHRDFHLNNLFFLSKNHVAVIDIQDVLVGPDTYDGVSLLSERATPGLLLKEERRDLRQNWADLTGAAPGWEHRWNQVRIQRALKVLGTFARLVSCGRIDYEPWMKALAADLITKERDLDLPDELVDILLD